ncbi:MAG: molybdate ABC transporter substrate-binding protein [Candidatus Thiodiazotropha sp.]
MNRTHNIILALLIGLPSIFSPVKAEQVMIAVAANFIDASREIARLFEQTTGHTTKISYGSTGKLYSQIEHGAPFELFLAADNQRPARAEEKGLAVPGSRFIYAKGRLVLWSVKPERFGNPEQYLKRGAFNHLALANPKTAPYGLAATQVINRLGLQQQLTPKLVRGESIAQTFQFVATGNAEAGFVALAQIREWEGEAGTLWEIPADYYDPIDQGAVLLKKGEANPAAIAYLQFLRGDTARQVIARYGYGVE